MGKVCFQRQFRPNFIRKGVPQHVKDRFYVFQMGGIAKPHNMFKVMRWVYMDDEFNDPVTRNFIFGVDTK
jgi:hypothetical protein